VIVRREFLKGSRALPVPETLGMAAPPLAAAAQNARRTLKILCVGAHPDDPESGCGGTLARYVALGHSVTVLYLTRGERGIRDTGLEEAAKDRKSTRLNSSHVAISYAVFCSRPIRVLPPFPTRRSSDLAAAAQNARRTLKILCVGAHPDDPESGCGGTLARYVALGHSVTVLYLTRGERGIRDTGLEEAA